MESQVEDIRQNNLYLLYMILKRGNRNIAYKLFRLGAESKLCMNLYSDNESVRAFAVKSVLRLTHMNPDTWYHLAKHNFIPTLMQVGHGFTDAKMILRHLRMIKSLYASSYGNKFPRRLHVLKNSGAVELINAVEEHITAIAHSKYNQGIIEYIQEIKQDLINTP
jgi:hypothetical protein